MFYTYPGAPAPYGFAPPPPPPACPGSFSFNYVLPPPAYCIVPPSPPPPAKKEEPKKKDPNANPADREGMNYLYPKHHATVHFIKEKKVWEKADTNFQVKIWTVPTVVSVRDIIEKLLGKEGEDCKGWALTEVNELGDGEFSKEKTIVYESDDAKKAIAAFGWNEKRGDTRPPVWAVLHKA